MGSREAGNWRCIMWAPLAALFLVIGAASTPGMIQAEREYLQGKPVIEVQDIQTTQLSIDHADRLVLE